MSRAKGVVAICLSLALCVAASPAVAQARWVRWSTPPWLRRTRPPTATRTLAVPPTQGASSTATRTRTATPAGIPTPPITWGSATPTMTDFGACGLPPSIMLGRITDARPGLVDLYYAVRECLDAAEYPSPPRYPTPGWNRKWVVPERLWLQEMPAVECPQTPGLRCCTDVYPAWWDGATWRKAKATMSMKCAGRAITLLPTECRWADGSLGPGANTIWGHELQHILSTEWEQYGRAPALHESGWRADCELPSGYSGEPYYR